MTCLMVFLVTSLSSQAADPTEVGPITLREGEVAPFDGTLLDPASAAKLIVQADTDLEMCKSEAARDVATTTADLRLEIFLAEQEANLCLKRESLEVSSRDARIRELEAASRPWKVKPTTLVAVGFGGGIVASFVAAWTLGQLVD